MCTFLCQEPHEVCCVKTGWFQKLHEDNLIKKGPYEHAFLKLIRYVTHWTLNSTSKVL